MVYIKRDQDAHRIENIATVANDVSSWIVQISHITGAVVFGSGTQHLRIMRSWQPIAVNR